MGNAALLFDELLDDEYDDYETYSNALDKLFASYQYDDEYEEFENDNFVVSDWWMNEDDDAEWIVTSQSMNGQYDDLWLDDTEWDQINKRIRTKSGHLMTRKCAKSMCLCQFADFENDAKFKCMARTQAIDDDHYNEAMIDYENEENAEIEYYDVYDDDEDDLYGDEYLNALLSDYMNDEEIEYD